MINTKELTIVRLLTEPQQPDCDAAWQCNSALEAQAMSRWLRDNWIRHEVICLDQTQRVD